MFTLFKSLNFVGLGFLLALSGLSLPSRADDFVQNLGPVGPHEPILGSFLLFGGLFGDDSDRGQIELACTKAKLEAMWGMPLPADLEIVGSVPKSGVASTGWDITEQGCSGAIYPTATLKLRE